MTKLERVEVDMLQGSEEESVFTPVPLVKQAQSTFGLLLRGCESIDLYRLFTNFNIQPFATGYPISSRAVKQTVVLVMNVSQTMETEEDHTCLHIKLYHPQQSCRGLYGLLPLGTRSRHSADDPLRLGRDPQTCTLALVDNRVSRKQLALHAYRSPQNPDMLFTIQNLSQRGQLSMNSSALGYLERADLPDKALIRFGEYEMLIIREPGEAKGHFEVELEILAVPPSRETGMGVPSMTPVMDTGSCAMSSFPGELRSHGPLETDETLWCNS